MANENVQSSATVPETETDISFEELESVLQSEIVQDLADLEMLQEDRELINNPDHLGETVMNVVWEQFMNQVAATSGADFIKDNGGLTLDLRDDAHIQTTENFANGKIAGHNTKIDYQQRYDDWQANFVKDDNGNVVTHVTRTGKEEATLVSGARKPFDADRPKGSVERHTDMDHTISAAEIIRDPGANAHMTKDEQIKFANSEANLNEMDSSWNRSKGDKSMKDWLNNPNANGQKPDEIFDISDEDAKKLLAKDEEARKEYDKQKKEAEERSVAAGKQSQKEEFNRIRNKALRTAFMALLAALLKEIIGKLVLWLKSDNKNIHTLLNHIKAAIISFVKKLKSLMISTGDSVLTTIAASIIGPVVGTVKKAFTLLKQGWRSLKEAINYLRAPENRGKPLKYLMPQVGIIVVTGLSGIGAIVLGEVFEKVLMGIPVLAFDIPLLGSPANLIGMLMGAIVCGIIGAIAINLINKRVAKQQQNDNLSSQIDKKNEILKKQDELFSVKTQKLGKTLEAASDDIFARRKFASEYMTEILSSVCDTSNEESEKMTDDLLDSLL